MFRSMGKLKLFMMLAIVIYKVAGDTSDNSNNNNCETIDVYDCIARDPCKQRQPNDGFYFAHDEAKKFVQCDDFDRCHAKDCAQGTVWSQLKATCISGIAFDVL